MKCSECGAKVQGKFCTECGADTSQNNPQQESTEAASTPSSFKKTLWLIPGIVLLVTVALVLWQFTVATGAASQYQTATKELPQAEQVLSDAQLEADSAAGDLAAVLACADYFGDDCSWVLGKTLSEIQADASAADAAVTAAQTAVDELDTQVTDSKKQVAQANQMMLIIGLSGLGLAMLTALFVFYAQRRARSKELV